MSEDLYLRSLKHRPANEIKRAGDGIAILNQLATDDTTSKVLCTVLSDLNFSHAATWAWICETAMLLNSMRQRIAAMEEELRIARRTPGE